MNTREDRWEPPPLDEFDSDELSREDLCYVGWRRTEEQPTTVSEAEALAYRAFRYGLALAGGLKPCS